MTVPIAAIVLVLVTVIFWGVGNFVLRFTRMRAGAWPVSIGIGVALTVFAGGLLNLAHIARAPSLWILAGIATVVCVMQLRRVNFRAGGVLGNSAVSMEAIAAGILIAALTLFAIATQLPPREFNFHDDFQKYFSHPVRMLHTGTLAGSTLSALGSETLGGQAFLQGFVLSVLPIGYINGVDAIFGFFALMLVAAAAGFRRFPWFLGAMLGPLLLATINPQYVNVSGLYTGSLLMATAMLLVIEGRGGEEETYLPPPLVLGLIYAALIAIKLTFAAFVLFHLPLAAVAIGHGRSRCAGSFRWMARTAVWTCIGALPWFLLYLPNYLAHADLPRAADPAANDGPLRLFSATTLTYGSSFAHYTALVLVVALIAGLALFSLRKNTSPEQGRLSLALFAGAASAVLSYLLIVAVLGRALNGYETDLRYAIPFLLGTGVLTIVLAPALSPCLPGWVSTCLPLGCALLIAASFLPSWQSRQKQAIRYGSILAFSSVAASPAYAAYNEYCVSDAAKSYVQGFQDKIPPGEPVLAWIATPFLLDYKRNTVIDADTMGISSRWARVPSNVRYVLWQYKGVGVRSQGDYLQTMQEPGAHERNIAAQDLAFANYLSQLAAGSGVIASDGQTVLFELPARHPN